MKTCMKCREVKDFSCFYAHKKMADGYLGKCKECAKKDVRENYANKKEQYQAYEKTRSKSPHRVEARRQYAKTDAGIKAGNMAKMRWTSANPIQKGASVAVNNAVRDGRIHKPSTCSVCGISTKRLEGHHDDYAFPLVVRWMCPPCHYDWHEKNEPLNGDK